MEEQIISHLYQDKGSGCWIVQTNEIVGEENVLEHYSSFNHDDIKDEKIEGKIKLTTENWDYSIRLVEKLKKTGLCLSFLETTVFIYSSIYRLDFDKLVV